MLKKSLLSFLSVSMLSSVCYAGGPTPSYYPKVSAISCIISSSNSSSYFWNDTKDCNDAILSHYAKGVNYKGVFKYGDGSEVAFDGFISPGNGYTPPSRPGKKLIAITDTNAMWVNW